MGMGVDGSRRMSTGRCDAVWTAGPKRCVLKPTGQQVFGLDLSFASHTGRGSNCFLVLLVAMHVLFAKSL